MAYLSKREAITFDDVLIKPRFSSVLSRQDIDTSSTFLGLKLGTPIISSNMDTITDIEMAKAMWKAGGLGILHRFMPDEVQRNKISHMKASQIPVAFSTGIRDPKASVDLVKSIVDMTEQNVIVTIDVAHGHHVSVGVLIEDLVAIPAVSVIAGNVATADGFQWLASAGAHAAKVGIGPGAACTTRTVTGVGVPQLSAIMDCVAARSPGGPLIIADGGIRSSGDIVKALAAGADAVMLGSMLAGCPETPTEPRSGQGGQKWHQYRGQSTIGTNATQYAPEGVDGWVKQKPPVVDIISTLTAGLRSGMSYVGAFNLTDLRDDIEFIRVSASTRLETSTRIQLDF